MNDLLPATSVTPLLLRDLSRMRLAFFCGQTLVLLFAEFYLYLQLPWPSLLLTLILLATLHLHTVKRLRDHASISDQEIFLQLLADGLLASMVFYQSGGASNPFVSYLLLPICFSALLLDWRQTAVLVASSALLYTFILLFPMELPPDSHTPINLINVHIWGMWLNFLLISLFLLLFISRLAGTLRQQQALLHGAREQGLRDARLLALASEAAGLAHELGTPLGSLQLLVDELAARHEDDDTRADLQLMTRQLQLCRHNLQAMVQRSQQDSSVALPCDQWLLQTLNRWQLMRPDARFALHNESAPGIPLPVLSPPNTLALALLNVLNNAADAAPGQAVQVYWQVDQVQLRLRICDQGRSDAAIRLAQPVLPMVGRSDKPHGLGIGLFLTLTILEQLGGELQLEALPAGGTCCMLRCPIASLHKEIPA